jgi:hypothetical protein
LDVIAWSAYSFNLVAEGKARYAEGLFVSGDFFRTLGARAAVGRVFTAADDRPADRTLRQDIKRASQRREGRISKEKSRRGGARRPKAVLFADLIRP